MIFIKIEARIRVAGVGQCKLGEEGGGKVWLIVKMSQRGRENQNTLWYNGDFWEKLKNIY